MVVQPVETFQREYIIPAHLRHTADEPLSAKASTRLRQMLARPGIVVAPGVCDGISARCALEAGFDCLYQSGAATTAAKLGMPDLAIATLPDFVQNASMITGLSYSTPLIADADTGFGGLHIEDQVQTKRCGHLLGKQVVSTEEFVTRIRAAVQARDAIPGSDIVIIARTDSAQVLGMDEAIRRLQAAAAVGADVAFIEGVKTKELLEKTVKALYPTPVLVNVISGGLTPSFTTKEAEAMGAKIIIFSLVSCVAAAHGIREAMALLKKTGTDHTSARGMDPRKFFEVVGLDEVIEIDRRAGGHCARLILAHQTTPAHDLTTQPIAVTKTAASPQPTSIQSRQPSSRSNPFRLLVPPSEPVCCLIPLPPVQPDPDPADDLLPFEEWKAKQLALSSTETRTTDHHAPTIVASLAEEPTIVSESTSTILVPVVETVGEAIPEFFPIEGRFNYASVDCTARVHSAGKSMKSASSILSSKKDKYMLAPCSAKNKHIVVELCDDIRVDTVQLANFEFFSGVFKDIAIYLGRSNNPHSPKLNWVSAGVFRAKNVRGIQTFRLYNLPNTFDRYIRIEFLSHYGKEYFCPVSLIRVYGLTQMEDWRIEEWKQEWQARRHVELTISSGDAQHSLVSSEPPIEEETTHYAHREGGDILAGTTHREDPSKDSIPASVITNDTAVSSDSHLRTNESGSSIPRNSSVDDRNSAHPNVTGRIQPLNSSSNATEDTKPTAGDSTMKARASKSKTQESASATTPMLKTTQVATPMPSTGGESIYRTIWNRLDMLERGSTLSLRYVEEQNQSVRQALRRLEEEVGRLRALTNREQQELQRSMRSAQQKQAEMEKRWSALLEQVNVLTEEVILEKRLGIAQLCLLTTVLVFMALTRGSRAETHLLSVQAKHKRSALFLDAAESAFDWGYLASRCRPVSGYPRTLRVAVPSIRDTISQYQSKPIGGRASIPQQAIHERRTLSSGPTTISVLTPRKCKWRKRPATGMKRLARTAHLHEVELDTQRRLRIQAEPAGDDNDTDHLNHDTESSGAPPTLNVTQHDDVRKTSEMHHPFEQHTDRPARKGPATVLGRRFQSTQAHPPDNGTEWEDTDADLDPEDPMQELIVEENRTAPRVPRLFSPPTPRTWGARRKARGFSVDTGSAMRMQCA
ncbi:unnamed protein product [Rhizoctonia solani]|uniref:SUN domain-containing protein n=1 Tax=Rhizoctonia solani TaxID=456999 RepID=A0A8H3G834_9AGAM|nr:unnamed protein product [Rhizoctonia solani]